MKKHLKRWTAIMIAVTLTVGCIPGNLQRKIGAQPEVKAATTLSNPRIVSDSSMQAGQKVTWDCVWFGSYPQTEIVDKAETCGTYGNEYWGSNADYEVNASTYSALQNASGWNSNGDIALNGTKYRRIKKTDATFGGTGSSEYYRWADSDTYHYFRYEPIKWRVLDKDGSTALLLADKALDDQEYNIKYEEVTWETSTIRSWLNGYGASSNQQGVDYSSKNFIDSAFTSTQRGGILTSNLTNTDNIGSGREGGNDTSDKVFLLSESEVYTDAANGHGFVSSYITSDEARRTKSSTYAKAMGTYAYSLNGSSNNGNCLWWLRSPGFRTDYAVYVNNAGNVVQTGYNVYDDNSGVRPALRLNLASSNLYTYAGTVCSDGTVNEVGGGSNSESDILKPFILSEDNNRFAHSNNAKRFPLSGFNGKMDYVLDKTYFSDLTKGLSKKQKSEIRKNETSSWGGSCYGIAATMSLVFDGILSVDDISNNHNGTYFSMAFPCNDSKLMNNINYCQLNQALDGRGSREDSSIAKYVQVSCAKKTIGVFLDLPNDFYTPSKFFEKMIPAVKEAVQKNKVMIFSYNDHAILITGYKYDKANNRHDITLYDENFAGLDDSDLDGTFTHMYVSDDCSEASFSAQSGDFYISDEVSDYGKVGTSLIDAVTGRLGVSIVRNMNLVDPSQIGYYKKWGNNARGATVNDDPSIYGYSVVKFPSGSSFTITNSAGQTLNVNDINEWDEDGMFDGDMKIADFDYVLSGSQSYVQLTIPASESFTINNIAQITSAEEYYGGNLSDINDTPLQVEGKDALLDISIMNGENYSAITTTEIQSAVIEESGDITIKPADNTDYSFKVFVQAENGDDFRYSGNADADVLVDVSEDNADVISEGSLEITDSEKYENEDEQDSDNGNNGNNKESTETTNLTTNHSVNKVKVSRITLTGISKKIARGKKIKLTATVLPKNATNRKLKWSSSNKKLATVTQSGLVKISKKAKPGKTVKITAAATDGSGKKQVWAIKVMKGAVKKITVKGYKKTLKAGKTMKLKAKVKVSKGKPVNKKLKWTSSNPKYATVTQTGKVKAKPAGKGKTVKIKVMSTDGTNKSVVKKVKIK